MDKSLNSKQIPESLVASVSDSAVLKDRLLVSFSGGETSAYMLWWILKNWSNKYDINNEDEFSNMEKEIKEAIGIMENIRSDNSELREWGNELHREKTDLENTVYQLEQRVSELERENSNYSDEIKGLEEQISELESQNVV